MVRTRKYLKRGVIGQVQDDLSVAFKLLYIGTGSVTSVTITTATDIELISVVGTTTYTDHFHYAGPATYPTVGSLVAAINATGRWQAKVMDALSTWTIGASGLIPNGAVTADANGEYNIMADTTNSKFLAYRVTYDRTFGTNNKLRNGHRVHIQEIVTSITAGGPDANAFKIYECSPGGNSMSYPASENLIYQKTPSNAAATSTTWASGEGEICGHEGNDLLVVISDGASMTGSVTIVGELE